MFDDFSKDKEMVDFINYSAESTYDDLNKSVVNKINIGTAGIAIKEFYGLKQKMYSFLVDNSSELKKAKGVNKNVATRSHNEYNHNEYKDIINI